MSGRYDDIINLPHYKSKKRAHMSMYDRAAQFSSFAALTGHSEAISEAARLTESKVVLNEEQMAELNNKISYICENIRFFPEISVTYFISDNKKEGGMYITEKLTVKKINMTERVFTFLEGKTISFDDIENIEILK